MLMLLRYVAVTLLGNKVSHLTLAREKSTRIRSVVRRTNGNIETSPDRNERAIKCDKTRVDIPVQHIALCRDHTSRLNPLISNKMALVPVLREQLDRMNFALDALRADVQSLRQVVASLEAAPVAGQGQPPVAEMYQPQVPQPDNLDASVEQQAEDNNNDDYVPDFDELMDPDLEAELDQALAMEHDGVADNAVQNIQEQHKPLHNQGQQSWKDIGVNGTDWQTFFAYAPDARVIRTSVGAYQTHFCLQT